MARTLTIVYGLEYRLYFVFLLLLLLQFLDIFILRFNNGKELQFYEFFLLLSLRFIQKKKERKKETYRERMRGDMKSIEWVYEVKRLCFQLTDRHNIYFGLYDKKRRTSSFLEPSKFEQSNYIHLEIYNQYRMKQNNWEKSKRKKRIESTFAVLPRRHSEQRHKHQTFPSPPIYSRLMKFYPFKFELILLLLFVQFVQWMAKLPAFCFNLDWFKLNIHMNRAANRMQWLNDHHKYVYCIFEMYL